MRRAARIDKNQPEIVRQLKQLPGVSVEIIGQPLDLLVGFRRRTFLFEVKDPKEPSPLTEKQRQFLARWTGQVEIVHSFDDIWRVINEV